MKKQHRRLKASAIGFAMLASVATLSACGSSSDDEAADTVAPTEAVAETTVAADTAVETTAVDTAAAESVADTEAGAAAESVALDTDVDGTVPPGDPIIGVQTMGLYDCGPTAQDPEVHVYVRFGDDGSFFAASVQQSLEDTRKWLGIDKSNFAGGTFTAEGSTFKGDTDPGETPGVLWDGGFADDGSIAANATSEINGNVQNYRCFFSED